LLDEAGLRWWQKVLVSDGRAVTARHGGSATCCALRGEDAQQIPRRAKSALARHGEQARDDNLQRGDAGTACRAPTGETTTRVYNAWVAIKLIAMDLDGTLLNTESRARGAGKVREGKYPRDPVEPRREGSRLLGGATRVGLADAGA
jgi:hypothetical protein